MEYRPIERDADAYQQPVSAAQIEAMCRSVLGDGVRIIAAEELGLGLYNSTYRLEFDSSRQLILRVAPQPSRQFRVERDLLRNEVAVAPLLSGLGSLVCQTVATDFSRVIVPRDYVVQTLLPGVPAAGGLDRYPRPAWGSFFRQLGGITAQVHTVVGDRFGPVADPRCDTWAGCVLAAYEDAVHDHEDAGLDSEELREAMALADRHRDTLDEIAEPRLLHGDLWTVNVLISPEAAEPTITGVCDWDRASWGDPLSDWGIALARSRPGTERDAFWDAYPRTAASPAADVRALIYRARDLGAITLERHRLGRDVDQTNDELMRVVRELRSR